MILIAACFVVVGIFAFGFFGYVAKTTISEKRHTKADTAVCLAFAILSLAICWGVAAGAAFGYPNYLVWEQGKQGEATLAKATQDRQVKVQEAEAEMEAATKQAEANKTLGESVREYPEAMEQKWVEAIAHTQNQVIYLPTEASVPITESGRMAVKKQQAEQENK